jgi:hypothetical protein
MAGHTLKREAPLVASPIDVSFDRYRNRKPRRHVDRFSSGAISVWMVMAALRLCVMNTYLQRICHRPF